MALIICTSSFIAYSQACVTTGNVDYQIFRSDQSKNIVIRFLNKNPYMVTVKYKLYEQKNEQRIFKTSGTKVVDSKGDNSSRQAEVYTGLKYDLNAHYILEYDVQKCN